MDVFWHAHEDVTASREPLPPTYDLLGPDGCFAHSDPPCFGALDDLITSRYFEHSRRNLFVAFDLLDLAVLRMMRFPATLATGLDQLNGQQIRLLFGESYDPEEEEKGLQSPPSAPISSICRPNIRLVLVLCHS
jgi:hypothetical protein